MNDKTTQVRNLFNQLINQPTRHVELGYGSFITLGFGKDLQYEIIVRRQKEIRTRPEWYLWVYMCFWELDRAGKQLCTSDDDRDEIREPLLHILNKKLTGFEIVDDHYGMKLFFEDKIVLSLFANNEDVDNVQWHLFTPEQKVLVAGPLGQVDYRYSSMKNK